MQLLFVENLLHLLLVESLNQQYIKKQKAYTTDSRPETSNFSKHIIKILGCEQVLFHRELHVNEIHSMSLEEHIVTLKAKLKFKVCILIVFSVYFLVR